MQPDGTVEQALWNAKSGDRDAFAVLVREHQSMVFSICWNYVRNEAAAEEMAQEVFLDLFTSIRSIESPAHLTFWLRRVAAHRAIDHGRRQKNRPSVALADAPEPATAPTTRDPFVTGTLQRLVGTLPEKARMVVLLRFQEDMDPSEIAEVLEMPLNTVKSHLQRSLAMLREKLERTKVRACTGSRTI
jgi:RNA polymerase sigma-70 factor (ECF subfamily)